MSVALTLGIFVGAAGVAYAAALIVPQGGTGWERFVSGTVIYGNGTGKLATTSAGTNGFVLALLNGIPTWTSTSTIGSAGGGSGNVSTSSAETSTFVPFWTSTAATPALLSGGESTFAYDSTLNKLTIANASSTQLTATDRAYLGTTTIGRNQRLSLESSMDAQDGENSSLELKYRNDLVQTAKANISFESSTSTKAWIAVHDWLTALVYHGHLSFETKNASDDELHTRLEIDHSCDDADCEVSVVNSDFRITTGQFFLDTTQMLLGQYLDIIPNNLASFGGNTTDFLRIATTTDNAGIALSALGGTYFQFADDLLIADNDIIGLTDATGRIEFDDQATDEINFLSSDVGIGTQDPEFPLHVVGATVGTIMLDSAAASNGVYRIREGGTSNWIFGNLASDNSFRLNTGTAIGTSDLLSLSTAGLFSVNNASTSQLSNLGPLYVGTTSTTTIRGGATSTFAGISASGGFAVSSLPSCDSLDTDSSGNIICGTDNPGTGNVATSTSETASHVAFWTSTAGTPATLGSDAGLVFQTVTDAMILNGIFTATRLRSSIVADATAPNITSENDSDTGFFFRANGEPGVIGVTSDGVEVSRFDQLGFKVTGVATTTGNLIVQGAGTSTVKSGLEAWRQIAAPYFHATNTLATSTFGGLSVSNGLKVSSVVSCTQALETDASGNIVCGTDATSAGGADPFTWDLNYSVINAATTSPIWAQNGINASSTSRFVGINSLFSTTTYASTTVLSASSQIFTPALYGTSDLDVTAVNGTLGLTADGAGDVYLLGKGGVGIESRNYLDIFTSTANDITFYTTNLERMKMKASGLIGVGTSTPAWPVQIASSSPSATMKGQLALTDSGSGANLKHWLMSSMTGNLYIGTTTDAYATSSPSVLALSGSATSTFALGLKANALDTLATSTLAGLRIPTGGLTIPTMASCDTIDTDASGNFKCGTDAQGAGSGGADFAYLQDIGFGVTGSATTTKTQFTLGIHASGTSQFDNATSTLFSATTAWITNLLIGADTIAEYIADTAGAMFTGNTETDITITYDDADNTIDAVVDTLPNLTGTLDYDSGGTGSTTAPQGQLLYGGATAYQSVATGTVSESGLIGVTAGQSVVGTGLTISLDNIAANTVIGNNTGGATAPVAFGTSTMFGAGIPAGQVLMSNGSAWTPAATATCEQITGSSALCDGNDATGAGGGGSDFTFESNYATVTAATSSALWAKVGIYASSTSHFVNASSTMQTISDIIFMGTPDSFITTMGNSYSGGTAQFVFNAADATTTTAKGSRLIMNAGDGGSVSGAPGYVSLTGGNATGGNTAGGGAFFTGGNGFGSGAGALVELDGGTGGATGNGGGINIFAGVGGGTSGNGGGVSINPGNASAGNSNGGNLSLTAGTRNGTGVDGSIKFFRNNSAATQGMTFFNDMLGIGTTTPFADLQIATNTGRGLVLSHPAAGADLKHWQISSMTGNLYIGTTTDLYATSSPAVLSLSGSATSTFALGVQAVGGYFTTFLRVAADAITDLTGTGLSVVNGALGVDLTASFAWTGAHDFGGASAFEIPNGTAPVVDAIGEVAFDTTDFQIIIATTTTASPRAIPTQYKLWGMTIASSSVDFVSGGRLWLPPQRDGFTIKEIHCAVDGGTSVVINLSNSGGTTDTETVTCDADGATDIDIGSNPTYTAGSLNSLEIGTITDSVDYVTWSAWGTITRE